MHRNYTLYPGYGFNFDLSHSSTHLGDKLFFFPLFKKLIDNNIRFKVTDNGSTNEIFHAIYGLNIPNDECFFYINIMPRSSFLSLFYKYKNIILVDFTDVKISNIITLSLVNSFNSLFNLKFIDYNLDYGDTKPSKAIKKIIEVDSKYVVFNNYVNSGFFRIYFINKNKLINKCISLKKANIK
jgi:hypothetical protein